MCVSSFGMGHTFHEIYAFGTTTCKLFSSKPISGNPGISDSQVLGECDGEIDYDKRRDALNDFNYVIRRRCVRADLNDSTSDAVYLGGNGRWHANIARARKFASLPAIDAVLQETWSRLRNAGERSVILSVVKTPLRDNEQAPGTREIERNRGADCPRRDG